jgi:hypothetical protein
MSPSSIMQRSVLPGKRENLSAMPATLSSGESNKKLLCYFRVFKYQSVDVEGAGTGGAGVV